MSPLAVSTSGPTSGGIPLVTTSGARTLALGLGNPTTAPFTYGVRMWLTDGSGNQRAAITPQQVTIPAGGSGQVVGVMALPTLGVAQARMGVMIGIDSASGPASGANLVLVSDATPVDIIVPVQVLFGGISWS